MCNPIDEHPEVFAEQFESLVRDAPLVLILAGRLPIPIPDRRRLHRLLDVLNETCKHIVLRDMGTFGALSEGFSYSNGNLRFS